jgi:hypothetical protein
MACCVATQKQILSECSWLRSTDLCLEILQVIVLKRQGLGSTETDALPDGVVAAEKTAGMSKI